MKLNISGLSKLDIEKQIKMWLKDNVTFIHILHRVILVSGTPLELPYGYRHADYRQKTLQGVRIEAYQNVTAWNPRKGWPILYKSLSVFAGGIQVAYATWENDSQEFIESDHCYFRPGDWIAIAQKILSDGLTDVKDIQDIHLEKEKAALMELLSHDKDL